jgi:hypothetical protein
MKPGVSVDAELRRKRFPNAELSVENHGEWWTGSKARASLVIRRTRRVLLARRMARFRVEWAHGG